MKIKKCIKKVFMVLFISLVTICLNTAVFANAISDTVTEIGGGSGLTNYNQNLHSKAILAPGVANITSGLFYLLDFGKYVLGSIAVLMVVIMGVRMVATTDADKELTSTKKFFGSAFVGIMVILIADIAVQKVFFGVSGEIFQTQSSIQQAALSGASEVRGIYTFIEMFLASVAVLMIIISGISMIFSTEDTKNAKNHIAGACAGLVLVGISEIFIKDFIFANYGAGIDVATGKSLLVSMTNFASSFIAIISVAAFVYAGYLYVLSYAGGDSTAKAKKIMAGAVIGILLAAGAFAISKTLIQFDSTSTTVSYVQHILI